MTKKEWLAIGVVSLFSGALGTILYTAALQQIHYSSYSVVVLLQQQLQPIWAIGTAAILLKEKVTKKFVLWAILALVAAYFITFPTLQVNLATGAGTAMAGGFAVLAGLMWGSSTAFSKYVLNKVSFLTGVAMRYYLAPLFALLFVIGQNQTSMLFHLTMPQFWTLLLITFSTGLIRWIRTQPCSYTQQQEALARYFASGQGISTTRTGRTLSLPLSTGISRSAMMDSLPRMPLWLRRRL